MALFRAKVRYIDHCGGVVGQYAQLIPIAQRLEPLSSFQNR